MIGVLLAGTVSVVMSPNLIENYLGNGLVQMLVMLALATPIYICATSSTPIAAILVLKGLSPGAALVFLLAGPATNMATITVVLKVLGKRATAIYLGSILLCSLMMGLLVNWFYKAADLQITDWIASQVNESPGFLTIGSALLLAVLIIRPYLWKMRSIRFHEA